MSTKIEWTDETINPIIGCAPISESCTNCYAKKFAYRHSFNTNMKSRYGGIAHKKNGRIKWTGKLRFVRSELEKPLGWKKPRRIFVCSMSDIFHDDVKTEWIDDILEIIGACPRHTFMFLTKRAHNIEKKMYEVTEENPCRALGGGDYLPNLWIGVTVESSTYLSRIYELLKVPAAVRFISVEPMLSEIDAREYLGVRYGCEGEHPQMICDVCRQALGLNWVICGAETGPGARPMDLAWARDLRDQCAESSIPFFFKKAGNKIETPPDLMVRQWPGGK